MISQTLTYLVKINVTRTGNVNSKINTIFKKSRRECQKRQNKNLNVQEDPTSLKTVEMAGIFYESEEWK